MLLQLYASHGISYYCKLFGKTRQAFYEQQNKPSDRGLQASFILKLVQEIRVDLPRCGTEKLLHLLQSKFIEHGIKIGRDGLYQLLGEHGYLIRFRRRKPYTTNSNHHYKKYPNLIRQLVVTRAGKLWVSDITYIRLTNGFAYLSIITDAYSHKVVGYKLHPTLAAQGAIDALLIASFDEKITSELIHHSDRGIQYCCQDYVQEINRFKIQLSMTENGDPYENPVAERINGILKYEHGLGATFTSYENAKTATDLAVKNYNYLRPHDSCNRHTPIAAHELSGILKKHWKPKKYAKKQVQETVPA
jgi:transposase InsO family protein